MEFLSEGAGQGAHELLSKRMRPRKYLGRISIIPLDNCIRIWYYSTYKDWLRPLIESALPVFSLSPNHSVKESEYDH